MPDRDKKLLEQLNAKHPDYVAWVEEWERYRDVLGDELVDKQKYLAKNVFEADSQYSFRCELSEFIPESGRAIEKIIGALYKEKPKREWTGSESLIKEFQDNADRRMNSWNAVSEEIAWNLLGYGTTRTLVNVPAVQLPELPGTGFVPDTLTRAEEKSLKIRPYVINYTPLSVIDWNVSPEGELLMVRIKEEGHAPAKPGEPHRKSERFIQYDTENVTWWIFVEDEKKGEMILSEGPIMRNHNLGMVPMVCDSLREIKPMIGHSFIRYASRADIQKYRSESDQAYDLYMHAHPHLAIWTEETLKDVGIGSNSYLKLNPGSSGASREDAKYLEAPASSFSALKEVIENKLNQIYRQANTDPMGVLQAGTSTFQASGVARSWSFGTSEARVLSKVADRMTQIEMKTIELVVRYQTPGELPPPEEFVFKGSVQFPEEFDMSATQTLLDETAQIAGMINSERLLRTLHKRIASSKVGDTSAQVLKEIHEEIENNDLIGTQVGKSLDPFEMPLFGQNESEDKKEEDGDEDEEDQKKKED